MDSAYHIPPYLLCEKLAKGSRVVDIFPPGEEGDRFLAGKAEKLLVVKRSMSDHPAETAEGITRIVAAPSSLPFARGAFDLVLALSRPRDREQVEEIIRDARTLLNPSGILAVMIPNREAGMGDMAPGEAEMPDFLEFERGLRRHFPHVTLYAQLPLYGAVLSPLGRRRSSEGPLLDDRLIPEGGETPTHFLALCSLRYRKVEDTTIAQLPFRVISESVRERVEKLEGALSVIRKENDARGRTIEQLREKLAATTTQLERAEIEVGEKVEVLSELSSIREKLAHRERLLAQMEEAQTRQGSELNERISSLHEANRTIRKLEQQLADSERVKELARRDREEFEAERQNLLTQLHDLQNEIKGKQRDLDDKVEQVAGIEAELAALHKEASRQRRELLSSREQVRKLTLQIQDIEDASGDNSDLETELERIRAHAAAERERLEQRADEEHRQLLEAIAQKEASRRETRELDLRLKEAQLSISSAEARNQQLKDQLSRASSGSRDAEKKTEELSEEIRALERANEELGQIVQEKADEIDRQTHTIDVLTARAREAESKCSGLQEQVVALDDGLAEAQRKASFLKNRASASASELERETDRISQLEQDLQAALSDLDRSTSRADGLQAVLRETEAELEAATERSRNLQEIADAKELEAAKAHSHISHMEAQLLTIESELEEEVERSTALEEKLALVSERNEELTGKIELLQPDAASSKNARQRAMTAEAAVSDLENVTQHLQEELLDARTSVRSLEGELLEARTRIGRLEEDLANALENLARKEEGTETLKHDSSEKIQEMQEEMHRLKEDNEAELMKVTEDMEVELRHANSMLEARQGELWELREEVIRLRAQSAATMAAVQKEGLDSELMVHVEEQEALIQELKDERDELRHTIEKQSRSLEVRKKNLKILAALLRKERSEPQRQSEAPTSKPEISDEVPTVAPPGGLDTRKLDIKALIEEAGGEISEEGFEEFDEAISDEFLDNLPTGTFRAAAPPPSPIDDSSFIEETAKEVDEVMDSVVLDSEAPKKLKPRKPDK